MPLTRFVVWMFSVGMMVPAAGIVAAQDFPSRPIRIVTSGTGGGSDFISRLIAQGISGPLGASVVVDNRTALVSIETTAKAQPDGYTLLSQSNILWLSPFLQQVTFDPVTNRSHYMACSLPVKRLPRSSID